MSSQEVSFDSRGCAIAETFTEAADLVAAALLIPGGGRSNRDSDARIPGQPILTWQAQMVAAWLPRLAKAILRITRTDVIGSQRKRVARIKTSRADVIRIQGIRVNARWFRAFLACDPRPALARITVPVLAITGGQDVQVPPHDVEVIRRLVNGPFEGHVAGDLSHLLRPDPDSIGPRGYRRAVRQPAPRRWS